MPGTRDCSPPNSINGPRALSGTTFRRGATSASQPSRPAQPGSASVPVFRLCRWRASSNTSRGRMPAEPEDRAEPFCPYFGRCGGCTLQHLGPAAYAALKTELVERPLRAAHIEAEIAPLIVAHGDGRRRATLHAR